MICFVCLVGFSCAKLLAQQTFEHANLSCGQGCFTEVLSRDNQSATIDTADANRYLSVRNYPSPKERNFARATMNGVNWSNASSFSITSWVFFPNESMMSGDRRVVSNLVRNAFLSARVNFVNQLLPFRSTNCLLTAA